MGCFKAYYTEMLECEDDPEFFPEPNEYEKALEEAEYSIGKSQFLLSCKAFYKKNKFLTEKQLYRLKYPRY